MADVQMVCLGFVAYMACMYFPGRRVNTSSTKAFSGMIVAVIVNLIFDIIRSYTVNHLDVVAPFWNLVIHKCFMGTIVLSQFLAFVYVYSLVQEEREREPRLPKACFIPLALSIAGLLFGSMHLVEVSGDRNYATGSSEVLSNISIGLYVIIAFIYTIRHWKEVVHRKRVLLVNALIVEILLGINDIFRPSDFVSGLGLSAIVFASFLTMESPDMQMIAMYKLEKDRADRANTAKSNFLARMSHEIRTPINAIIGMNEMIIREYEDEELMEYTTGIENSAKSLLGIVNDILDLSRIESGKLEIYPAEYSLSSTLNELINMVYVNAKDKNLFLNLNISQHIPDRLYADSLRIKQVAMNLLTNALKYTPEGSINVIIDYEKLDKNHIMLWMSVVDTGVGIREEDMGRLFESFERLEEQEIRQIEGTGLGLNITKRLVDLMGGKLEVESTYGEGSTFTVSIPQKVLDWSEIGDFKKHFEDSVRRRERYHSSFTAKDAKIVIVDDNEMNRKVVTGLLKATRVQVTTLASGMELLGRIEREHFDLIFLDHMMPVMDGIECLQRMRTQEKNMCAETPVIALTANVVNGARERYLDAGFDDFLAKPIDTAELEQMIRGYLPAEMIMEGIDQEKKHPIREQEEKPKWVLELEQSALIDYEEGVKRSGSQDNLYEMMNLFCASLEEKTAEIVKYLENNNRKNYVVAVHALKSSARIIGSMELSSQAEYLEKCGNSGNMEELKHKTGGLLELYREVGQVLGQCIVQEPEVKTKLTETELADILKALSDSLAVFDVDGADWQINRLKRSEVPKAVETRLPELIAAVADLNVEKGIQMIDIMYKELGIEFS